MTRTFAKFHMRRLENMPPPSKIVAIVVPLSTRPGLDADEEISLRHLLHYLGKYDKFMIAPQNMDVDYPGFQIQRFDQSYFGSAIAHARLQFSPEFYEAFCDYKYIFVYHLDALVFSDQLLEWCNRDFDFIGAPWFQCEAAPWVREPHVGNSGFALLKVRSFLRVLYSRRRHDRTGGSLERNPSLLASPDAIAGWVADVSATIFLWQSRPLSHGVMA